MANVQINVEVRSNGEVVLGKLGGALDTTAKKADALNARVGHSTERMGKMADAAGRTATTLARSADAFGLNAAALRTLDDVMDVAELGFGNMTKAAVGFNAATLGVIGAGAALGAVIGSWLNKFESVRNAADKVTRSILEMFGAFDQGKIANATAGMKQFSMAMGASNTGAIGKQIDHYKSIGMSVKDIAELYRKQLTPAQMEAFGLSKEQVKSDEKRLQILKAESAERQRIIAIMKNERPVDYASAVRPGMGALMGGGIATSLNLSENRVTVGGQATSLMGSLMGLGPATSLQIGYFKQLSMETAARAKAESEAAQHTRDLIDIFGSLATQLTNLSQTVGGFAGTLLKVLASLSSGAGGIFSGVQAWQQAGSQKGILGFLGKASGALGIVGSAVGLVGGLIGGLKSLFGGKSREQREAERQAAEDARKQAEAEAAQKRAAGLTTAQGGIATLIDNLTYQDAAGQLVSTFSDPKVAEAAAGLFGGTFWETFRKQGIAGIDGLRPAWTKLHEQLVKMGLDPVKLGLGRIGQLMDITGDPRTKALLGVSQGAGSLLRGAMDAGYVDQGFVRDSTTIARSTLAELQAQGLDQTTAAQAMADQLAALAQSYAATGQQMPDDLKAAMEAAGLTVLPTQLEVLKESRDYLKIMAGREGFAGGGAGDFGRGAWYPLHGREAIVPLDRPSRVGVGGSLNVTIQRAPGTTKETEYAFDKRVESTMRKLLRHSPTIQLDARVAVNGGR